MGKDREGKFHPPKGKPAGNGKENSVELHLNDPNALENYLEMAGRYTAGEEEMPANVHVRHPNRNPNKGEERQEKNNNTNSKAYKSRNETFKDDRTSTVPEELPGILTKEVFTELAAYKSDLCISGFMTTHSYGVDVNEQTDVTGFKSILQNLALTLRSKGSDQTKIQKILEPGYELLRNENFWLNLSPGLAFFIADGYFKYVKMPQAPSKDEVLINTSFFLMPLVPAMVNKDYFYLLVISKKQARFYRADAFGIQYIPVPEMPNGVEDVVHFEEKGDQKLFRTDTAGAGGGANFHGMGSGAPDEKQHLAIYLEEVDETLWKEVLNRENVPLVLAGVDYLIPIFKSVSQYNFIWNESLKGSHEYTELHELYKKVRPMMDPYFEERVKKALENYGNNSATALTSSIPADVIPAAHYGRVGHLFVQEDEHIWGTFDEMSNELKVHETKQDGDECLIDKSVIKTIMTGGEVHFLKKEDMPAESKIAALMRWE